MTRTTTTCAHKYSSFFTKDTSALLPDSFHHIEVSLMKKSFIPYCMMILPAAVTPAAVTHAAENAKPANPPAETFADMFTQGKVNAELRYRYEEVDQDGIDGEAYANTLRTRLRFTTATWQGFSGLVEWDNVTMLGDDNYNDTRNKQGSYPLVADPEGSGINQAYIKYTGFDKTAITAGRQRVNLDNQRFIGSVGWRQNEQTLDGGLVEYKGLDKLTATYGYFSNVSRIFGPHEEPKGSPADDLGGDVQVLNLKYALNDMFAVTGYGYLLDLNELQPASSQTLGLRFTGKIPVVSDYKLCYSAEYADQSDYSANPVEYDADYALAELTFGNADWELQAGYELLGSDDGKAAVQTPLATLHKFQGWADKFLTTPTAGLVDTYVGGTVKFHDYAFTAVAHEYEGDEGGEDFGTETNLQVAKTFAKNYTVTLKYADYQSGDVTAFTDTSKIWLMAEAKF